MPHNRFFHKSLVVPSATINLLALLAVGLVVGCVDRGPPTAATSREPVLVGARVVRAPENPRFHAGTQLTFQGRRLNGGCVFGHEVTLKPGEHVVERIAEYDLDTCLYVVERGGYDFPSGPHQYRDTSSTTQLHLGAPSQAPSLEKGNKSIMMLQYCARSKLWFEDPIGIDVTRSELHVIWTGDGAQVWDSWAELASRVYETSGWYVVYHDLESHFVNPEGSGVETNGYSTMANYAFPCPEPAETWTYYAPNTMTTYGNGIVTFYSSAYAAGGCSSWLTLYSEYWTDY
jgi:hypothetical protein